MNLRHSILSLAGVPVLAATLLTACGGSSTPTPDATGLAIGARDAAQLYVAACASCHGLGGEGGLSNVPLDETTTADRQQVIAAIRYGLGGMPASSAGMSEEEIKALADYVAGLR